MPSPAATLLTGLRGIAAEQGQGWGQPNEVLPTVLDFRTPAKALRRADSLSTARASESVLRVNSPTTGRSVRSPVGFINVARP